MNTSVTGTSVHENTINGAKSSRHEMVKSRLAKWMMSEDSRQDDRIAGDPPLPAFMCQPIDAESGRPRVSPVRRVFRSATRIGSVGAVAFTLAWGFLNLNAANPGQHVNDVNGMTPSGLTNDDPGLILGTAISQAFAADTAPTGLYQPGGGAATYGETMSPEELKLEMQRLQKEIEMIERQAYDMPDGMNLMSNDSLLPSSPEELIKANTDDLLTEDELSGSLAAPGRTDVTTPRWQEPLTPPRWREPAQYGQPPGGEGIVTSLDPPIASQWSAPPQWMRTAPPEMEQNQYGFMPEAEDTQMAMTPPGNTGAFRIQLGSFRSARSAQSGWRQLLSKNEDLLGVLEHSVEQADLGERGLFYRLHAGSFADIGLAKVLCGEIKARNTDCLVVRR